MSGHHKDNRGAALVTALLVVALAASVASAALLLQAIETRREQTLEWTDQARLYALSAERWVRAMLASNDPAIDAIRDASVRLPPVPLPMGEGQVEIMAEDLTGRFNLNSLAPGRVDSALWRARIERLLALLGVQAPVGPIIDWIDPDSEPTVPYGAEDDVYLRRSPPYRAGNTPLADVTELQDIEGFESAYTQLEPYVCALPEIIGVNVNTASPEILNALGLDEREVETVLRTRKERAFTSPSDFWKTLARAPQPGIGVSARYLRVHTKVTWRGHDLTLESVLARDGVSARVLQRALY